MSRSTVLLASSLLTVLAAGLAAGAWSAHRALEAERSQPFDQAASSWLASSGCRSCHPDRYASWHRTFHRTMTQDATDGSVQGAFDGREITYQGVVATPTRHDERFVITFDYPARPPLELEVVRTVGSRRYQQYLARLPGRGENLYRVPLLWHIEDRRWVHLNGAFLGVDGADYDTHLALWDQNCVLCHNTGPAPGLTNYEEMVTRQRRGEEIDPQRDARHRGSVAELGVGCESCHGPAGEHARRNRDPFRRYWLHTSDAPDPTVVHPARLSHQRAADVCGQCHGQRMPREPEQLLTWMTDGPSFRAGASLYEHVAPVWRESIDPFQPTSDVFRRRFWNDGTPRLTAYEYQGLLQSPCFQRGELTCTTCHTMHGGDVFGQLPARNRSDAPCLACHEQIANDVAGHSRHGMVDGGVRCYDCHMPKMVYGIMEIHRSHRIENPDPVRAGQAARPDACTGCHLDRSLVWAAEALGDGWGRALPTQEARRAYLPATDDAPTSPPPIDLLTMLHAGDPVERAVAARLAGRPDSPLTAARRVYLIPHLMIAMDDSFPAIRRFAHQSLRRLADELEGAGRPVIAFAGLDTFDFMAPREVREAWLERLADAWSVVSKAAFGQPPEGSMLDGAYRPRAEVERLRAVGRSRSDEVFIGE